MAVWLADMWYSRKQRLTEKSGAMKRLPENIKVLYIASDCMEPYVEVRYSAECIHIYVRRCSEVTVEVQMFFCHRALLLCRHPVVQLSLYLCSVLNKSKLLICKVFKLFLNSKNATAVSSTVTVSRE